MIDLLRTHASVAGAALIAYMSYSSLGAEGSGKPEEAASKRDTIGGYYLGVVDISEPRPHLRDPCGTEPEPEPEPEDGDEESPDGGADDAGDDDGGLPLDPALDEPVSSSKGAAAVRAEERTSFVLELQATLMLGRHARARISGHDLGVGDEVPVEGIDHEPPVVLAVTATTVEVEWADGIHVLDLDGAPTIELHVPRDDDDADSGGGFGAFFGWGSDG